MLFGILTLPLLLSACDGPAEPPIANGAEETAYSFKHHTELSWNRGQLNSLKSLFVQYSGHVSLIQSTGEELTVQIQIEIEKSHNPVYADEYLNQVMAQSNLQTQDEKLLVPFPAHPCKETFDSSGQLIGVEGVCVREMLIAIPSTSSPMPLLEFEAAGGLSTTQVTLPSLSLILDDGSHSEIDQFTGSLKVRGGGPRAALSVYGLLDAGQKSTGELDVDLDSIGRMDLQTIAGKIHIAVTHPPSDPAAARLDGKPIPSFPFNRP